MGLEITIISARDFLDFEESSISSEFSRYQLVWIASRPELQISILGKLTGLKSKIVLEKPIATNKQTWNKLNEVLLQSSSRIFYSQPWTYSNIWKKCLEEIINLNLPISIDIHKSGEENREIFSGAQDWLPHDLFLFEDLLEKLEIPVENLEFSKNKEDNNFSLAIANKITANITYRASHERDMRWVVSSCGVKMLEIDFFEMCLKWLAPNAQLSVEKSEYFSEDHPLENMLSWYLGVDLLKGSNYVPKLQVLVAKNFEDTRFWNSK